MVCIISSVLIISIHAPTNGATSCDILSQAVLSFQSTLRRTERRTSRSSTFEIKYFNPRSDERSDNAAAEKDKATQDFLWGFVREQVEEEATVQGIVDKIKKAGDTGIFFVDSQLGQR